MQDNFEQLKSLKELLESGAISKVEYDNMKAELLRDSMANDGVKSAQKPSGFSAFMGRHKWKFILLIAAIIGGFFAMRYFATDPKDQGKKLAESYCDCQKKKNEAYIARMTEFIETFETQEFQFAKDVEPLVTKMDNEYDKSTLTPDVSNCFKAYELKNKSAKQEWKNGSSDGKLFWSSFETTIINNTELVTQEEEITLLKERIQSKMAAMIFDNPQQYEMRKYQVSSILNGYFGNLESTYFDAYQYFAYTVEQYLKSKNITPTEINIIQKKESDYTSKETKLIDETLELTGVQDDRQTWKFSTEFKAYRTSMEKYQVCNIWYEIILNKSGKIVSYKEIRTENKRMLTPEEYNVMFNGGTTYESEASDW
jgi:hypothetical protein